MLPADRPEAKGVAEGERGNPGTGLGARGGDWLSMASYFCGRQERLRALVSVRGEWKGAEQLTHATGGPPRREREVVDGWSHGL